MRVEEWGTINVHLIVVLNYTIPSFIESEIGENRERVSEESRTRMKN